MTKDIRQRYKKWYEEKLREAFGENLENFTVELLFIRKLKYVDEGKPLPIDKPKFTVMISVEKTNIPIPAEFIGPIFKFKKISVPQPDNPNLNKQEYLGICTVEEFMELPCEENKGSNKLEKPGTIFSAPGVRKTFDSMEEELKFEQQVREDVTRLIKEIHEFVKVRYRKEFEWSGRFPRYLVNKNHPYNITEADFIDGDGRIED
jgi:hypothetical protein